MRTLVDMRFGPGTWQSIVDLRNKRIKELKEAKAKARREAIRRQKEMMENIKLAAGVGMVMALGIGLLIFLLTIL